MIEVYFKYELYITKSWPYIFVTYKHTLGKAWAYMIILGRTIVPKLILGCTFPELTKVGVYIIYMHKHTFSLILHTVIPMKNNGCICM